MMTIRCTLWTNSFLWDLKNSSLCFDASFFSDSWVPWDYWGILFCICFNFMVHPLGMCSHCQFTISYCLVFLRYSFILTYIFLFVWAVYPVVNLKIAFVNVPLFGGIIFIFVIGHDCILYAKFVLFCQSVRTLDLLWEAMQCYLFIYVFTILCLWNFFIFLLTKSLWTYWFLLLR